AEAPGTFRLAFGTNDFRKDTGFSDDPMALAYARSRLTIASRMGGLPGAIDGPSAADADDAGVRRDAEATHVGGRTGKLVRTADPVDPPHHPKEPSEEQPHWGRQNPRAGRGRSQNTRRPLPARPAPAEKVRSPADTYGLWNA